VKKENNANQRPHDAKTALDEAKRWAAELLDRLPDKLRLPAVLYFSCGLKQEEIAAELRCRQAVVSTRLQAVLNMLRRGMSKKGFSTLPTALPALLAEAESATVAVITDACAAKLAAVPAQAAARRALRRGQSQSTATIIGKKGPLAALLALGVLGLSAAIWFEGDNLFSATSYNGDIVLVSMFEVKSGKDFRLHVGGHNVIIDDVLVRTAKKEEMVEPYPKIVEYLRRYPQKREDAFKKPGSK
jgi:hypothetical protein